MRDDHRFLFFWFENFYYRNRFCDFVLFSIFTYRDMTVEQKFEYFKQLVDIIDPFRKRVHIILPLLVRYFF